MLIRAQKAIAPLIVVHLFLAACAGAVPQPSGEQPTEETASPTFEVIESDEQTEEPTPTSSLDEVLAKGQDAANRGDWEAAIDLYDVVISFDPANARAYQLRGDARRAAGDLVQAIEDYDQAITLDPNSATVYNSRGLANTDLSGYAQAFADFGQAVEIQPGFGLVYRNRAEVQIIQGHYEAAVLDLRIYLALVPNALDTVVVEAQITSLQGNAAQAAGEEGLLYFDDFSDFGSGWYSNGDPSAVAEYSSDGYRIVVTQESSAVWALPGRLFTNVRIEVLTDKQGGDDDNFFGVMCRVQGTTDSANFYLLMISSDGYYGIAKRVNGGELALIGQAKLQFSNAINLGSVENRIRADCSGDTLSLYANDVKLVEVVDADLSTGQIGLLAGTFTVRGTNILFDEIAVYAVQAGE